MGNSTSSITSGQPQMGQSNQNAQGKGQSSPQASPSVQNAPAPLQQPQVQPTPQSSFSPPQNTFNSMMGMNQWDNQGSSSPSSGKGGAGGKSGSGGSAGSGKGQSSTPDYQAPTTNQSAIPQLPQYQVPVQQSVAQQAAPTTQILGYINTELGGNMSGHGGGGGNDGGVGGGGNNGSNGDFGGGWGGMSA